MTQLNYNERSWVIDLISEINLVSSNRTTFQFRATGEQTLTTSDGKLFPDLILQDENLNVIQGWECKFPDTSILDDDLLSNAKIKAETLNLESFLVWNVKEACLYLKNNDSGEFEPKKNWFRPEFYVNCGLYSELDRNIYNKKESYKLNTLKMIEKSNPNFHILQIHDFLCNSSTCPSHIKNIRLYRDNQGHLTVYAAKKHLSSKIKYFFLQKKLLEKSNL